LSALPDVTERAAPPFHSLPSLDGLRAVAILLVLAHQLNRIQVTDLATKVTERAVDAGWFGVTLFFCLSGFLITGILLDDRDSPRPLRDFFVRRVLRIFPLYFGALALFVLVLPRLGVVPPRYAEGSAWHWVFLCNWTIPHVDSALPHFWSLAIEEQFYVVWPFVVMALAARKLLALCLGVAAAALAYRLWAVHAGMLPEAIYMSSFARMDALALGAAVAVAIRMPGAVQRLTRARARLWMGIVALFAAGAVITRLYPALSPLGQTLGYSVLAVVFAATIANLAARDTSGTPEPWTAWLRAPALRLVGTCSFGMYVFHKPLHDLVGKWVLAYSGYPEGLPVTLGLAYIVLGSVVVFASGLASYLFYERPFLRLARRLAPRPGSRPLRLVPEPRLPRHSE